MTSSLPDPVEDPEMSETVAQDRHEEVEGSDAVSDSDADRRQTLSRPPTLSGPYYEPGTVEGRGFENTFGQSLARPLLTAIDTRRLSTSPADLDSSDGRRSSTPPCIPLAKRGDGVTGCQDFAPNPTGGAYSALPALPLLALLASRRDGTGSRFLTLDPTRPASFSPGDPIQSLSELKQILDSEHVSK